MIERGHGETFKEGIKAPMVRHWNSIEIVAVIPADKTR